MQAKIIEERHKQSRELNLRVGLPPPSTPLDPMVTSTSFLHDTLEHWDVSLGQAWIGGVGDNSTLCIWL